jgi:hypothetical protein
MHELVFGTVATGEGAFCPGHDFTPPDEPRDEVNNASRRSSSVLSYTQEDEAAVIIPFPYSFPSVFESEGWPVHVNKNRALSRRVMQLTV